MFKVASIAAVAFASAQANDLFKFDNLKLDLDGLVGLKSDVMEAKAGKLCKGKCVPKKGPYAESVPVLAQANFGETKTIFSSDFFDIELRCLKGRAGSDDFDTYEALMIYREKWGGSTVSTIIEEDDGSSPALLDISGCGSKDSNGVYTVNESEPRGSWINGGGVSGGPRPACVLSNASSTEEGDDGISIDEDDEAFITLSNGLAYYLSAEDGHIVWVAGDKADMGEFNSNCGVIGNMGIRVPKGVAFEAPAFDPKFADYE